MWRGLVEAKDMRRVPHKPLMAVIIICIPSKINPKE
jgi:hypothetical protein